jgi:hypothetical protein
VQKDVVKTTSVLDKPFCNPLVELPDRCCRTTLSAYGGRFMHQALHLPHQIGMLFLMPKKIIVGFPSLKNFRNDFFFVIEVRGDEIEKIIEEGGQSPLARGDFLPGTTMTFFLTNKLATGFAQILQKLFEACMLILYQKTLCFRKLSKVMTWLLHPDFALEELVIRYLWHILPPLLPGSSGIYPAAKKTGLERDESGADKVKSGTSW